MLVHSDKSLIIAKSVADAVAALADHGEGVAPLAGATWIMRAPIRQELFEPFHVGISTIAELRHVEISDAEIAIGSCVTHARLVSALASIPEGQVLKTAADTAANPAIRQVATIGGNICTAGFAASDLVPALLCLDADIELATQAGIERMPIAHFLSKRRNLAAATLLTRIIVPRKPTQSMHVRLPLRKAGDYPVAILSLAAGIRKDGAIETIRIAVGSVEPVARRWEALETELVGRPLDPQIAFDMANTNANTFQGRDGIDAPGWYRVKVLPSLMRRAVQGLLDR